MQYFIAFYLCACVFIFACTSRDREFRREDRRDDRGSHRDLRDEYSGRDNRSLSGSGAGGGRPGHSGLRPSSPGRRDSRSEWKSERNLLPLIERRGKT